MKSSTQEPFIAQGELHGLHKLTEEQVLEMRRRHSEAQRAGRRVSLKQLSEEFGVRPEQIKRILRRVQWAHLP